MPPHTIWTSKHLLSGKDTALCLHQCYNKIMVLRGTRFTLSIGWGVQCLHWHCFSGINLVLTCNAEIVHPVWNTMQLSLADCTQLLTNAKRQLLTEYVYSQTHKINIDQNAIRRDARESMSWTSATLDRTSGQDCKIPKLSNLGACIPRIISLVRNETVRICVLRIRLHSCTLM